MPTILHEVQRLGQSIWYDNMRRGLITSGELKRLVVAGVTGLTANPTIFQKAIAGSTDYDEALKQSAGRSPKEVYELLAIEDIQAAADLFLPAYRSTGGADGYASLEVSPGLAYDTEGTVAEARRLFAGLARPNVMVKVPATPQGIPAIRRLTAEGVNVNVTLTFAIDVYKQVAEAYIAGLEELARAGGDVKRVSSVASFFVSRMDVIVDRQLHERIQAGETGLEGLLGKAGIANAKLAYQEFRRIFGGERFAALKAKGARVQRPLWASTSTKDPAYDELMYVHALMGPDTVDTVPPATLTAFLDHGRAVAALEQDVDGARRTMEAVARAGIDVKQVTDRLTEEGVQQFVESFEKLMQSIEAKVRETTRTTHAHPGHALGGTASEVDAAVARLDREKAVERIWRKDHTVWATEPTEITDRLGWLTVADIMTEHVPALEAFAADVREAGFRHAVLLGMGGSSLGPEVLRQTFGSAPGSPELTVLDTTVPEWLKAVTGAIDVARTLFLVSSKSGTTIETVSGYKYFRNLAEHAVGKGRAGGSFVAITDAGTPLARLGKEQGFRRVFLNPADIGGRYSVLSYFGLVPAALIGLDLRTLLDRAEAMREGCASCVPIDQNPGAWLGAAMGSLALKGRDKLTLVTPPAVAGFGLWVEQLLAESTGKQGKGIIPVAGEPLLGPEAYGDDRLFVHIRPRTGDNAATDAAVKRLSDAGQPVIRLDMADLYDLGAEFYRWEFATAVAGALLGLNPFDQPDVQAAKDKTNQVLREYQKVGWLPHTDGHSSIESLLAQAGPGDYFCIQAYLHPTQQAEEAIGALRGRVMQRRRIATTAGYGPRFLHSTGQLHKGGPNKGLFLQITAAHEQDIPIPDAPYTFGTLADAQALGDYLTLREKGRRVARARLEGNTAGEVARLARTLA